MSVAVLQLSLFLATKKVFMVGWCSSDCVIQLIAFLWALLGFIAPVVTRPSPPAGALHRQCHCSRGGTMPWSCIYIQYSVLGLSRRTCPLSQPIYCPHTWMCPYLWYEEERPCAEQQCHCSAHICSTRHQADWASAACFNIMNTLFSCPGKCESCMALQDTDFNIEWTRYYQIQLLKLGII